MENNMTDQVRPQQQEGPTDRKKTGCGYLYLTNNIDTEYPEFFLRLGKQGGCPAAFLSALAKVSSLALRAGVKKEDLIRIWKDIRCPNPMWDGPVQILSCPDAVSKALSEEP
ncbi:MAG: TSCPD domain-containing protein [Deltaproteobacteria bacterium]|nr:MAG: TSCPD domain-containing protein [Deltaproteobacteria bacterium]